MGRPRVHDEAAADALLDAAEAILLAEGLPGLTVRRVAQEVGTSTRAVYSSLGSKEALLARLAARAFDLLGERVVAVPRSDDPATDLVTAGTVGFRGWVLEHPALFRVAFLYQVSAPHEMWPQGRDAAERALGELEDLIQRVAETGGLRGRTVRQATYQFHCLCEGLAVMDLRGGLPGPRVETMPVWRDALGALVAGWGVREPAER